MKRLLKLTKIKIAILFSILIIGTGETLMALVLPGIGLIPSKNAIKTFELSKNFKDGVFVNGIPAQDPKMFDTLMDYIKGNEQTTPDEPVTVLKRNKSDFASLPVKGLRTTWIGHSTSLVEIDGARLLLDPMWSPRSSPVSWTGPKRFYSPPIKIDELPSLDAVLISHDHYDHLDRYTVIALAKTGVKFIVPLGVSSRMVGWGVDSKQIEELDWWGETKVKDITVTATPARHFSGRSMRDRNKTLWSGFAMSGPKHKVYYSGDTGMFPGFTEIGERLGPFDVAMLEVGAYNKQWADLHLGPEQAIKAAKMIKAKLFIPVHWGTFNLALHSWTEPAERIMVAAAKQNQLTAIPKPGESIEPDSAPPLSRWWPKIKWQTEDQNPIVASGI